MKQFTFICLFAFLLSNGKAEAHSFKVYSPRVEKGVVEIETKNRFDFDSDPGEDGLRQHTLSAGYGFTDWWATELELEWEKEAGSGYRHTATAIENTIVFFEPGENWLDTGARLNYEFSHEPGQADAAVGQLLLEKAIGRFVHTANFSFEGEVGSRREGGVEFDVAWKTGYLYAEPINPAFEYYGEFGPLNRTGGWDRQGHRLGPVVFGEIAHHLHYDMGWLFGLSDGATDHVLKLNLGYEFSL